jgi:hypothetical protein
MYMENPEPTNESILKPKAKRTLTDEQRLALAQRMRAVNDKRIADAMARKQVSQEAPPPAETPKVEKKKRIVRVVELSEAETDSESEEEIVIVPKKKVVKAVQPKPEAKPKAKPKKKAQPVYEESEEEEAPQPITKPKAKKPVSQPVPEAPKILYRFL